MARKITCLLLSLMLQFFVRTCLNGCSDGPYFDKLAFNRLEGNSIKKTAVSENFKCFIECSRLPECLSLNIADQPNKDGLYECVLLREVTSQSLGLLRPSQMFHHYTRRLDLSCKYSHPLGMKSGAIPDARITASSIYHSIHSPARARLDMKADGGSWAARTNNLHEWLQVDLGNVTKVTGIATQGRFSSSERVKSYSLQYSVNGRSFNDYESGKIFKANNDSDTVVKHSLKPAIIARYIRVRPKTWNSWISMRMELYGCI